MDSFLTAPLLQPKFELAEYVAAEGFDVPPIYSSASEALEVVACGEFIDARSEHPQEYAGASGLLESFSITPQILEKAKDYDGQYDRVAPDAAAFFRALQKKYEAEATANLRSTSQMSVHGKFLVIAISWALINKFS